MSDAVTKIVERQGSKVVDVMLAAPLSPEMERFLGEYLMRAEGVAYLTYHEEKMHLAGYGIFERYWEQFRFWLGVAIYDSLGSWEMPA